jgi:hypothetical protein
MQDTISYLGHNNYLPISMQNSVSVSISLPCSRRSRILLRTGTIPPHFPQSFFSDQLTNRRGVWYSVSKAQ